MKFTCEKYLLQNAVSTASRAAAVKSAVAALEGLLIEAIDSKITISGYDLKTGINTSFSADVHENGQVVLNSRLFGDIIRKMPGDIVTITVADNLMTKISSGVSEFEIMATPSDDYPELPSVDSTNSMVINQKTLKSMISQTCFAVSDNEARPIHTGALFEVESETLTMVAVDGYRLALRKETLEETSESGYSFVVPGSALNEVEKILVDGEETVTVNLGSKHIMFKIGDTTLISRRLEGEFLNYNSVIPNDFETKVKVNTKNILETLDRVSLFAREVSEKEKKAPIKVTVGMEGVEISCTSLAGDAKENVIGVVEGK